MAGTPDRLRWARRLQAIAQSGLTYTESAYERERFEAVRAIAAEIASSVDGDDPAEVLARFAEEHGYATPKVDVRGVVISDRRVLLVREVGDDRWTLPGGFADVGQSPREAVEKEVLEEAGIAVRALRVLAVYDRDFRQRPRWPAHCYKLYVLCEAEAAGTPAGDGVETEEAAYFDAASPPPLSVKTPAEHLQRVLAIAADPSLGADLN